MNFFLITVNPAQNEQKPIENSQKKNPLPIPPSKTTKIINHIEKTNVINGVKKYLDKSGIITVGISFIMFTILSFAVFINFIDKEKTEFYKSKGLTI